MAWQEKDARGLLRVLVKHDWFEEAQPLAIEMLRPRGTPGLLPDAGESGHGIIESGLGLGPSPDWKPWGCRGHTGEGRRAAGSD